MKVEELVDKLGLTVLATGDLQADLSGMIVGDLLSFVMAKGQPGWGWITIHSHVNVAAVAVLRDIPLVIVAAGRPVDEDLVARCDAEGITLAKTEMSAYGLCGRIYGMGLVEGD
ncbi:conserved hypothetical protein [Dethiosulfovibrio peptidovorans DSM 11002]|uniref:HPr kinase n=1 Tax=Dethiosulfovibrio peptidovorans DSM 11002 TaxID=469381 RepID=D2Z568_9BACT|nr:hypothetical protein [Dethiosulfovibrio peptidovorans]EFC90627.1 conserved hypothetical protein [Dethiosulfovibrio peptidovorans DSM 11002]